MTARNKAETSAKHQQYNIGVKGLITKDGRVLFLKRRDYPTWELPGGRINEQEDIQQALVRELAEELPDLKKCEVEKIAHLTQTDFTLPNGNRLMLLFFKVLAELPVILHISEEHEEARWVSEDELDALEAKPYFKHAAKEVLQNAS